MSKCECKECVHEKVCRTREFPSIEEILKDGCPHFKSKSLFVELTCRCKDCRKRNTDDCWISFYGESGELYCDTLDDNFCSYGERKLREVQK